MPIRRKNAREHIASVWRGDFHNAKQVLAAMKKRLHKTAHAPPMPIFRPLSTATACSRRSKAGCLNLLAVEIGAGFTLVIAARTRCACRAERCVWAGQ